MLRIDNGIDLTGGRSNRSTFWVIFGFVLVGLFVGQLIAGAITFIMAMINGLDMETFGSDPNALYDYLSLGEVLSGQMFYTIFFTLVTPWFYLKVIAKKNVSDLSPQKEINLPLAVLAFAGTFAFMLVNSYIVEWNQSWSFPEFLSGFEDWARALEDDLAATTEKFTDFQNFGQFALGMLVISILPGIGEELLFRGVVQNSLHRWTKNPHVAIWIAAFLFSFIHFQFFGLVPRMVLGAIFGYLYVWSGNLWYPIIAHMTNNGISVLVVYLVNIGMIDMDIDETESIPMYVTLIGLVLFLALMFLFKKQTSQKNLHLE
jgi:membrane protease YdiL (CAAX protease family)